MAFCHKKLPPPHTHGFAKAGTERHSSQLSHLLIFLPEAVQLINWLDLILPEGKAAFC